MLRDTGKGLECVGSREAMPRREPAGEPRGACFEGMMVFRFSTPGAVLLDALMGVWMYALIPDATATGICLERSLDLRGSVRNYLHKCAVRNYLHRFLAPIRSILKRKGEHSNMATAHHLGAF